MTNADRLNYLNIALMVGSCAAAFVVPFEMFLFAYAVLGPLHYLTEISWLHDRRYFLDRKGGERLVIGWLALIGLTLAVMIYGLVQERLLHGSASPVIEIALFYAVFVTAAALLFSGRPAIAIGAVVLTGIGAWAFSASPWYGLIAFLIITIIHVLVFTAAFVLLGALRARSASGIASFVIFVGCVGTILLLAPRTPAAGAWVQQVYKPFAQLNQQLIAILQFGPGGTIADVYDSDIGRTAMRLIAFAYTYHYLNWFTKTSVIGWHRISRVRAGIITLLWIGAVAIYAYDYVLGFVVLYALSVLHVMLELPLNHQSFAGIGRELIGMIAPPPQPAPQRKPGKRRR